MGSVGSRDDGRSVDVVLTSPTVNFPSEESQDRNWVTWSHGRHLCLLTVGLPVPVRGLSQ